jgi:hypothetical protein
MARRGTASQIRKKLNTVVSPKSKLTEGSKPKATWVEPSFVAEVENADFTPEGLLRKSCFKGLFRNQQGSPGFLSRPCGPGPAQSCTFNSSVTAGACATKTGISLEF